MAYPDHIDIAHAFIYNKGVHSVYTAIVTTAEFLLFDTYCNSNMEEHLL